MNISWVDEISVAVHLPGPQDKYYTYYIDYIFKQKKIILSEINLPSLHFTIQLNLASFRSPMENEINAAQNGSKTRGFGPTSSGTFIIYYTLIYLLLL